MSDESARAGTATVKFPETDFALHHLFEAQVRRTPDQAAVAFEGQKLTYAELDRRADRVALLLRGLSVGPDEVVGLLVQRSLDMVVAVLGILKAGAAYLPIDPATPAQRVTYMLGDARVAVLVTERNFAPALPPLAARVVVPDAYDSGDAGGAPSSEVRFSPEHLAYVIYTSGSTGLPKGVAIEHRSIVNYVLGVSKRFQFRSGMNHAMVSTVAADLGHTVFFPALTTGGCLHVISEERSVSPEGLSEYFAREMIDVLKIVPSHLAALQSGRHPERVLPRRCLILGGEASRLDWIGRILDMSPSCEIYNHYGPTETTVGVLTYHVESLPPRTPTGTLPLGEPLPNNRVYILDERGEPVAPGAQGEIWIGGAGVARGYLNRSDLTAERFVLDPFGTVPGGRLYRTGDLGRCLPDGNIEFCGRIDRQVKIHGHRVELGEIERALLDHKGVRDAVVVVNDDSSADQHVVAYVVPKRATQPLWGGHALHLLPDGTPVAHLNRNETEYIYKEIFVLQAYLRHGITINDGDCIVDAGANIGLFTVFASRVASDLRILAFEPNPTAYECLKANAEAWGTNVKCLPFGLSSENRTAELTFFEGLSLLSGIYADAGVEREVVRNYVLNQDADVGRDQEVAAEIDALISDRLRSRMVSVQLRTLSSVMREEGIDCIDLLKVNVEKSELDVLLGISSADWPKIRQVVIEVDLRDHLEPITSLLVQQGYEWFVEQDPLLRKTELCYVYAIRPAAAGPRLLRGQDRDAGLRSLSYSGEDILTSPTLRARLKEQLPQYMIPSGFVLIEKIPLTSNGKVDRSALPSFSDGGGRRTGELVLPQTETERMLVAILSELLKVDSVSVHDDFFELGGTSLMAIKAVSKIREVFDVNLPMRAVFDNATIASLGKVVDQARERRQESGGSQSAATPIRRQFRGPAS